MSPDVLPVVIVDQILELLGLPELLALSSTCKSLRTYANYYLYRKANEIATNLDTQNASKPKDGSCGLRHLKMLEDCLALNPRNAQYVREHTAISLEPLREVWSQVPLNLTHLNILDGKSWFHADDQVLTKALAMLHPDSIIQEISVGNCHLDGSCLVMLKALRQFRGLRKFTLTLQQLNFRSIFPPIFHIFTYLECPGLEHLVVQGYGAEGIAYPDSRLLPNLLFLEILPSHEWRDAKRNPSRDFKYSEEDDFENLKMLMDKGISFRYGLRLDVLIEFVSEGVTDDAPIIKWLLMSECRIQHANNGNGSITLDFCKFKPLIRNKVFRIISSFCLPQGVKLIIRHGPYDLFPPLHFLAGDIRHFAIHLGDIDESVIKNILTSIPNLYSLNIATTISNEIFNLHCAFPPSVLFNDVYQRPLVYKFSLKGRWDVTDTENGKFRWVHITDPKPFQDLVVFERKINDMFIHYSDIKDVCFYFTRSESAPVPWFK